MLRNSYSEFIYECGTDEAGRGCLAGPVTAAAVILPKDYKNSILNDSKTLNEKKRILLEKDIQLNAIAFATCHIYEAEIDNINILNASIKAMHGSIKHLEHTVEYIIVDGNKFKPYYNIPYKTIVKGDSKYLNIAAASILAKNSRDRHMKTLHDEFPMYDWLNNKGYPTKAHRDAIKTYGITKYHRKSFRLLPDQYSLNL